MVTQNEEAAPAVEAPAAEPEVTPAAEEEEEPKEAEQDEASEAKTDGSEWKQGRRMYEHGGYHVTWEEFRECPMGRDILNGEEPFDAEKECEEAFRKLVREEDEDMAVDHWALQEMEDTEKPWDELTTLERVEMIVIGIVKFCAIWGVLYMFIISLGLMGNAFKILGGKSSGRTFRDSDLLSNPVAGLAIGILSTVMVQSSSTTTSIVISMAASDLITVTNAAYLVMGANIGTSVTNTIVSIGHLKNREEFRRAFSGAVFHDMFNWLTVAMFLPLEVASGFLEELAAVAVDSMGFEDDEDKTRGKTEFIKKITKPASGRVVSVDKKLITKIAEAETSKEVKELEKKSIIKQSSGHVLRDTPITDNEAGVLLLFVSLTMLTTCLLLLVKLLQSALKGRVATWTRFILNLDFKNPYLKMCGGLDNYILLLFGIGCTILVQSSSVFTSTITPLVGIGLIHIEKLTALTQGANIGTTVTGVLSALSGDNVKVGMKVALEHVFFNTLGTFVWFFIWPLRPVPLAMAKFMGETAANIRWFPAAYILLAFVAIPGAVVGLSVGGWEVLVGVGVPIITLLLTALALIWIRRNRADLLPRGSALRSRTMCGKELPNFMQLWGGDLSVDRVDLEKMRAKELKEKRKMRKVIEWPYSPVAWGMAIFAFVGITLAIPTSQWRRIRYGAKDPPGRKEVGFGLWEVCSDTFKKDQKWLPAPAECTVEFMAENCAQDLVGASCPGADEGVYAEALRRCSLLGCRPHAWDMGCRRLPGCDENDGEHVSKCLAVLGKYRFWLENFAEANGVQISFKSKDVTLPRTNLFPKKGEKAFALRPQDATVVSGLPAAALQAGDIRDCDNTTRVCSNGVGLAGVVFDECTGDFVVTTSRAPITADCPAPGTTRRNALPGFAASMTRVRLEDIVGSKNGQVTPFVNASAAWTQLKDASGNNLLGGVPSKATGDELLMDATCTNNLAPNAVGVSLADVKILRRKDGKLTYIGTDELGPRIFVWDDEGKVLATYTTVNNDYTGTAANVYPILPEIFKARGQDKGLSALAAGSYDEEEGTQKVLTCMRASLDGAGAGTASQADLVTSNVVRCAMLNIGKDFNDAKVVSHKVVLQTDDSTPTANVAREFTGAAWLDPSKDKVLLLEHLKHRDGNTTVHLLEADFGSGSNINETSVYAATTPLAGSLSGLSLERKVLASVDDVKLDAAVSLAKDEVEVVRTTRLRTLGGMDGSRALKGLAVVDDNTVVVVEDNEFGARAAVKGHSALHAVKVSDGLGWKSSSVGSCEGGKPEKFAKGDKCRDIDEVCPEGGLKGDMEALAGLIVTGTLFLGLATVMLLVHALMEKSRIARKMIFPAAGCMVVAWIMLFATWTHEVAISENEYTCYLLDESLRGGMVENTGKLKHMTMPSYSWAFCIYAWGMATLSLIATLHRVYMVLTTPPPPEEEESAKSDSDEDLKKEVEMEEAA